MQKIVTAAAQPVENGPASFHVIAYLGDGQYVVHNGPKDYAFFTADEAKRLADRVTAAGSINMAHWYAPSYDREAWNMHDMENEYYAN